MNATEGNVATPTEEQAGTPDVVAEKEPATAKPEQPKTMEAKQPEQPVNPDGPETANEGELERPPTIEDRVEAMERQIADLEAFKAKVMRKLHMNDQEVTMPGKQNYNPDYLPHGDEGPVSYHQKPKSG